MSWTVFFSTGAGFLTLRAVRRDFLPGSEMGLNQCSDLFHRHVTDDGQDDLGRRVFLRVEVLHVR